MSPAKTRPVRVGVMLCKTLTEQLAERLGPSCFAQRKYRGQRCRVAWIDGKPLLLSSYGVPFYFMEHIQAALMHLPKLPYDGELYNHEMSQEQINSICNRSVNRHEDSEAIQYHIYDIAAAQPQSFRFMTLDNIFAAIDWLGPQIQWAGYKLITTGNWYRFAQQYLFEGYEGIILRSIEASYYPLETKQQARKLSTILKWKPRELRIYPIVGYKEGEGWCKGMLGSYIVENEAGIRFAVGTGPALTKAKRKAQWDDDPELLIGKRLRVRHEPTETTGGIPICTSAREVI
jgi:ATP-dependent DNA ligase